MTVKELYDLLHMAYYDGWMARGKRISSSEAFEAEDEKEQELYLRKALIDYAIKDLKIP